MQVALREYAAAKQSHEQALAIRRKALPPDHPDIASESEQPGGACRSSCGSMRRRSRAMSRRWPSAARPCRRTTPISPEVCTTWGWCSDELREYAAAKQSHEQALAIRRKALPPDHPDIATV